jgi:cell division protein FtsB
MKCLWGQGNNRYLRVTRRRVEISPKLARFILAAMLVIIVLIFTVGDVGLYNLWRAQQRYGALRDDIAELDLKNAGLELQINRLQNDDFYIEKVARERYGYLKPGDLVYRIVTLPAGEDDAAGAASSLDNRETRP